MKVVHGLVLGLVTLKRVSTPRLFSYNSDVKSIINPEKLKIEKWTLAVFARHDSISGNG